MSFVAIELEKVLNMLELSRTVNIPVYLKFSLKCVNSHLKITTWTDKNIGTLCTVVAKTRQILYDASKQKLYLLFCQTIYFQITCMKFVLNF